MQLLAVNSLPGPDVSFSAAVSGGKVMIFCLARLPPAPRASIMAVTANVGIFNLIAPSSRLYREYLDHIAHVARRIPGCRHRLDLAASACGTDHKCVRAGCKIHAGLPGSERVLP